MSRRFWTHGFTHRQPQGSTSPHDQVSSPSRLCALRGSLGEIRAETLQAYLDDHKPTFDRVVGFRPTGWTYTPPSSRFTDSPTVHAIIHSWKTPFSHQQLKPQRGSTTTAVCFGAPYSEHSVFLLGTVADLVRVFEIWRVFVVRWILDGLCLLWMCILRSRGRRWGLGWISGVLLRRRMGSWYWRKDRRDGSLCILIALHVIMDTRIYYISSEDLGLPMVSWWSIKSTLSRSSSGFIDTPHIYISVLVSQNKPFSDKYKSERRCFAVALDSETPRRTHPGKLSIDVTEEKTL